MIYDSFEANNVRNHSRYILLTTASAAVGSHIPSFWQMNGIKWNGIILCGVLSSNRESANNKNTQKRDKKSR